MKREFPFSPKSNLKLLQGDFWQIPLDTGRFACGRVLELPPKSYSTRAFLAGLLDWVGDELPTFESIANAKLIEQGNAHIKTITENDGFILGNRPLELDNIEPFICREAQHFRQGYSNIEIGTDKNKDEFPQFSTWGYRVIKIAAEQYFGK